MFATFIDFLTEEAALSSNDKGVLHELLVGKELNKGKHMSPEAERTHNIIKSKTSKE